MTALFSINFRREAFLRERAKVRRRAGLLGLWLAYFGALAIVLGLYGLNAAVLAARARMIERQVVRLRAGSAAQHEWRPSSAELSEVGARLDEMRRWRDQLQRLPAILPAQARLVSLQYNPDQVSGGDRKLVISGEYRVPPGRDRTTSVMAFVDALSRDSVFSKSYRNIRLVSSRASASGPDAEFVIECR